MLALSMVEKERNEDLVDVIQTEIGVRMKQKKIKVIDLVTLLKAYAKMGKQ